MVCQIQTMSLGLDFVTLFEAISRYLVSDCTKSVYFYYRNTHSDLIERCLLTLRKVLYPVLVHNLFEFAIFKRALETKLDELVKDALFVWKIN